jgi:hypothetical protein
MKLHSLENPVHKNCRKCGTNLRALKIGSALSAEYFKTHFQTNPVILFHSLENPVHKNCRACGTNLNNIAKRFRIFKTDAVMPKTIRSRSKKQKRNEPPRGRARAVSDVNWLIPRSRAGAELAS